MTTSFRAGETVRINTPGESHHKRTGVVVRVLSRGRVIVDLGDARWMYLTSEVEKVDG